MSSIAKQVQEHHISIGGLNRGGALDLIEAVKNNTSPTTIYFNGSNDVIQSLMQALEKNTQVQKITMSYKIVTQPTLKAIIDMIKTNQTLKTMDFSRIVCQPEEGNSFGVGLADALSRNATLTDLSINSNEIGAQGMIALTTALGGNTTLLNLMAIQDGVLKTEAIDAMAIGLSDNTSLEAFLPNLSQNSLLEQTRLNLWEQKRKNLITQFSSTVTGFTQEFAIPRYGYASVCEMIFSYAGWKAKPDTEVTEVTNTACSSDTLTAAAVASPTK